MSNGGRMIKWLLMGVVVVVVVGVVIAAGDRSASPASSRVTGVGGQDRWRNAFCRCWNATDDSGSAEVECKCSGFKLERIPHNLARHVQRM